MEFDPLEDSGVKEKEGFPVVRVIISAHGFTHSTGLNGHICVALPPKHTKEASNFVLPMLHHVLTRGEGGGLSQKVARGLGI